MMRDQDFGIVRLRAYGTYDFRVADVQKFLKEVAGTDDHFRLDEFNDTMRSRIVSVFSDALAQAKVPALDVAARYSELGEALLPVINPILGDKYGLAMTSFILENVSVPPEVEQAIDKRSSMAAVGNLNDYVKYQMGAGHGEGRRRRRRRRRGRDGRRHGDGAADDESVRAADGADDEGHRGAASGNRRCAVRRRAHESGAGGADARRRRIGRAWRVSRRATSRARRSARSGACRGRRSTHSSSS